MSGGTVLEVITGLTLKNMLLAASYQLDQEKDFVNALNVFPVPDGDTGTNMSLTMEAALKEVEKSTEDDISQITSLLANGSLMGARGNSGVILSQFFRGFAAGLTKNKTTASGKDLARAFLESTKTTYRAVMKPVEGTMLTVGRLAADGAALAAEEGAGAGQVLKAALAAALEALENTPNILPVLKEAGVVDAGGQGLVCIFQGFVAGLEMDRRELESFFGKPVEKQVLKEAAAPPDETLENKYCTEFIILGANIDQEMIKSELESKGDSMIVVGDPNVIKVHLHTDVPGDVLQFCAGLGELTEIAIDNMLLQRQEYSRGQNGSHEHSHRLDFSDQPEPERELSLIVNPQAVKGVGLVAVVPGKGLAEIFSSLGVECIVPGGQTMNPSTEDLVKAINTVNAESVIILPNNKNVIFSAQQAKELVDKKVGVVPTRSVPQGISALLYFAPDQTLEDNLAAMDGGRKEVQTGEITFATRSTVAGDLQIEERDIIGLVEGKIAAVGSDPEEVAVNILENMVNEESSVISIYYGADEKEEAAQKLSERAKDKYPQCEVEMYSGGQPLYYYILSVE
ncbi:MAG: DAK2 domain-containing protein [Firmicutes bacterium]|nr:DAK2 domain-containing protein [Bacillota bacterium]